MSDAFESALDRLSNKIDSVQFERLRWSRTEAPMLEHLVGLTQAAFESRPDYELSEEGSSEARKRFVIKIHGFRTAAFTVALEGRTVSLSSEVIERGRAQRVGDARPSAPYEEVDQAWMNQALAQILGGIE
jgi:hypothetical protein